MGTTYSVQVTRQPAGVNREQVQRAIDDVLEETNRLFSTYDPGSEISRFNASDGTSAVEVSPEFARLLTIAEGVSVATRVRHYRGTAGASLGLRGGGR
jgi:thiamine biosynthesis lipoprotein